MTDKPDKSSRTSATDDRERAAQQRGASERTQRDQSPRDRRAPEPTDQG